jgi:hypothetical protein
MALLKLNVILLAPLPIPPLPVIVMVGTSVIVFVVVMIRFRQGLKKSPIGQKLDFANHPYLCKGLY